MLIMALKIVEFTFMNQILHLQSILTKLCSVACRAGERIMEYYGKSEIKSELKHDGTVVTEADKESERIIISFLKSLTPDIPIISEEQVSGDPRLDELPNDSETKTFFWLIDPLDGTEGFIRKKVRFSVNIGLVRNNKPMLGVIYFPVSDILYTGITGFRSYMLQNASRDVRCEHVQIRTRTCEKGEGLVALFDPRIPYSSELKMMLHKVKISRIVVDTDCHRLCRVSMGEIDIATISRSFEWDTIAGHAILKGAGGSLVNFEGTELQYGKPGFNNPCLMAHGRILDYGSQRGVSL
jgi:3'(2'), 5'-bisphosphate nucleotidase